MILNLVFDSKDNYRKHFETLYLKKFVDKALKECVEDVEHFLYEVTYSV